MLKDARNNEIIKIRRPRFILFFIPLFIMARLTDGVAKTQQMPAPFEWIREYALMLYNVIFGTLNEHNIFGPLAKASLFIEAVYSLWSRRRRAPVTNGKKFVREVTIRIALSYLLLDMVFVISLFLSASLNLLNAVADAPAWVSSEVEIYGYVMMAYVPLHESLKRKMSIGVRDPTVKVFDPVKIGRKILDFLAPV